jgi:sirohydrochlorin ferrochelatase/(2Fe-2S) ferredoxin
MSRTSILIVGHGSREPSANEAFEHFVAAFATQTPFRVAHAYIELAQPLLEPALCDLAAENDDVVVAPLLLFTGLHVKNDFPLALARARKRYPGVRFVLAPPLGVHPNMADALYARFAPLVSDAARTALVVVGRGASDPDANGDMSKLARLATEGRGFGASDVCFAGIAAPGLEVTLERAVRHRPAQVVVTPYMLFAGRLTQRITAKVREFAERAPWIQFLVAAPLGMHLKVFATLHERIESARRGQGVLPCDTCQYRRPIGAATREVGGLRALLWSVRHEVTHGQAMPHEHAHRPLAKHVLVCTNADCANRGSIGILRSLRRAIKDAQQSAQIRVTRTGCMGRCGEGPTLVVYPDGVWYRGVSEPDVAALVHEHLLGDRLVAKLVDSIMS